MASREEDPMEHDFVYCPGCTRYSVVHWQRELNQWQCEDCSYRFRSEEAATWTTPATLAS
jgi:transposase-like protein